MSTKGSKLYDLVVSWLEEDRGSLTCLQYISGADCIAKEDILLGLIILQNSHVYIIINFFFSV